MFNIGGGEMVVIGVVALLVVGPEGLPQLFRTSGQFVGRMRAMADEFRRSMEAAADETGANDLKKQFQDFEDDANKMAGRDPLGLNKAGENLRKLNGIEEDEVSLSDEIKADIQMATETVSAPKPRTKKAPKKTETSVEPTKRINTKAKK